MTDSDKIIAQMGRHRYYKNEIRAALDSCDGNREHARAHYFNLEHLEFQAKKMEAILLLHVPDNFLQNQLQFK